jgi:hypothetical protein
MRTLTAIILFILASHQSPGQDISNQITYDAMRRWQDTGTLIYLRSELSFSEAQKVIITGKLSGGDQETKMNKLFLTKADNEIVLQKLKSRHRAQWKDSLFENSKGLLRDTLQAILYDRQRGWPYFHQNVGKGYFQFSEPIFIRNGRYALLTLIQMVGNSAGYNLLFVYKKEGADWKRYIMMPLGAW